MSFLSKLFGGGSGERASTGGPEEDRIGAIMTRLKAQARPCLRLVAGEGGRSRLGGLPEMADDWPEYHGHPLSLVAQLDLEEVRAAGGPEWLPQQGRLLFFYLVDGGGWGFAPDDAGGFVVRHEVGSAAPAPYPANLTEDFRFAPRAVTFLTQESVPDTERLDPAAPNLSGKEERALEAALTKLEPPEPRHQIGGYPAPVQGDQMELQCQLVTNGLNVGSPNGYQAPEVERLSAGAADWRLLLQIDTDEDAEMMWGDTGRLYFWIREQDARAADFSKVWMVLQCY